MLYPGTLDSVTFFRALLKIDEELAEQVRKRGCSHCGGPLHRANYPRQPRGGQWAMPEKLSIRISLCCGREGCRRRATPPSCRFFGRRVYWSAVVLMAVAMRQGRSEGASAAKLRRLFGVTRLTLKRWVSWFREVFPGSRCWQRVRGRLGPQVHDGDLPGGLLEHFAANFAWPDWLRECLRLLAMGQDGHVR